ncbi:hypothetical protein DPMN_061333 [Dreissena polymorpha]|uniref:Uncharacterized protein n=1 Tax=Dreissena polymorpha TaxID=45954 RepID=A0A9D4C7N4_DREPO|nr:hypothetical protein DPMN_061333 [Dreissena polymorpha]
MLSADHTGVLTWTEPEVPQRHMKACIPRITQTLSTETWSQALGGIENLVH